MVHRHTAAERLRAKLKEVKAELRQRRHDPVPEVGRYLAAVVRGHGQYFGIPGNRRTIRRFRDEVSRLWHHALSRRSQKGSVTWDRMHRLIQRFIPPARIVHPSSSVIFAVMTQGKSPVRCALGKAGISLPVKVRSGQSRADRPAASLAGVAVTRGLKRKQQVHGVYGSNPEMGLLWRPSWEPYQRRQHGCSRYARGRPLRRGLRVRHVHTVDTGTQEVRQGPLAGHQRTCQGREDYRLALCPGRKSDWPVVSMRSPKATR